MFFLKNLRRLKQISAILHSALENEYALDLRYRSLNSIEIDDQSLPNYKVMKQAAIKERLGSAYPIVLWIAPWIVFSLIPIFWMLALIGSSFRIKPKLTGLIYRYFPTTEQAKDIITSALVDDSISIVNIKSFPSGYFKMGRLLGFFQVFYSIFIHILLLIKIGGYSKIIRRDMIFHGRDAFYISMVAIYSAFGDEVFVTDDHYQRWAHILSHTAEDFRIVQHGFLDEELILPNSGGTVTCLYLRDSLFRGSFERYYTIVDHRLFSLNSSFIQTPLSADALLLASSFPTIDQELMLINTIRSFYADLPIIVKFHPVHRYDSRREKLAAYANLVYEGSGNPGCRIFVSYGSFMEFDYRRQGIATVSIVRSGSIEDAADEIRSYLGHPVVKTQETR